MKIILRKSVPKGTSEFVNPALSEVDFGNTVSTVSDGTPNETIVSAEAALPTLVSSDFDERRARVVPLRPFKSAPVFPFEDLHSLAAEQYRIIRTKIRHHHARPRVLVVSSPKPGDGKTTTTINLAGILALSKNAQVLLIDADLRRAVASEYLGLPREPGLADVLRGDCDLEDAVVRLEQFPSLWVLPSNRGSGTPAELLESAGWRQVLDVCRRRFTYVVIDATPVMVVADFELVQAACDGVIMVIRQDHTERHAIEKAFQTVSKEKLIGTVLNCVEDWFLWKTADYGYGYPGSYSY